MARKTRIRKGQAPGNASAPLRRDMDSLIQGVSQQPAHLRAVGQGEEQINGWSSPLEGLTKRNAMRLQAKILNEPIDDFYLEMMDVSTAEQYSVFVRKEDNDKLRLMLMDQGTVPKVKVHGPGMEEEDDGTILIDDTAYLHNSPGALYKDYVLINSGPLGLLLNRNKPTAYTDEVKPVRPAEGIIFVKAVAYDVKYTITIDDVVIGSVTTPKASDDDNQLSTSDVAKDIAELIDTIEGYTIERVQYVVWIRKDDNTEFKLEIDDSRSEALAVAFNDKVPGLSYLPIIAPNNYVVQVTSDPGSTIDDRWLIFATNNQNQSFAKGSWSETLKPGIKYKLDRNTMPLVIYRAAKDVLFIGPADGQQREQTIDGETYTYTFPTWGERSAGDEQTVPDPAFIGNSIKDHMIFRSRYVVCAGETVTFSEVDDVFNFFIDTSLTIQDTDPFDLRSVSERSSPLQWMIPIDDSIFVFSSTTQFQITAADREVLTPLTGSIARLSNLEMNSNVRPKLAGAQILFATNHYGYTHFREFSFFNAQNRRIGLNLGSSNDITNLVPKYIEGLVTHWDVGEAVDVAVTISPSTKKELYVYKYLWENRENGTQKLQQSWSKWATNQDIQWVKFMDNVLYLLVTDDDGTYFTVILLDEGELDKNPQIYLDRLCQRPAPQFTAANAQVTASYDATTDKTTFTMPYTPEEKVVGVVRFTGDKYQGLKLGETTTRTLVCVPKGDWTNVDAAFGEPYEFMYQFNQAHVLDKNDTGDKRIGQLAGRTQVTRWLVNHVDTGEYYVRVKRRNRPDDSVHHYRARALNVGNNALDVEPSALANGSFSVPVCSRNTECTVSVESDSWLPTTITSASWEGLYSDRSKGVS